MKTEILEIDLPELQRVFNSLETVSEKFDFWENSLNYNYIRFFIANSNSANTHNTVSVFDQFSEFRIHPKTDEYFVYNNLILKNYRSRFELIPKMGMLLNLEKLQEGFEKAVESTINKKEFIILEIKKIEELVSKSSMPNASKFTDNSYMFFEKSFKQNYLNNIIVDLSLQPFYDIENIIAYLNGETISKQLKFINQSLEALTTSKTEKENSLSLDEQILVLEYLGLFSKINAIKTKEKKAKLISLIIGKNDQYTREFLSLIDNFKSPSIKSEKIKYNSKLKKISNLFEEVGLISISKRVKTDFAILSP